MQLLSRNVLSTDINYWGCREFYLVTEGVRFYHLNWYDRRKKRMSEFGAFSEIPCISGRCFDSVEKIGEEVAAKYNFISWVYIGWMDGDSRTGSFTPKFRAIHAKYFSSRDKKNEWTQFLAKEKIESFDEFMAYVVLAEALTNATPTTEKISLKEKYVYRGVHNAMRIANPHQIVLFGSRGYGFLSCYGIKENPYEFFTNPFDKFEWMSVFLAVFALGLINSDPVDVALAGFAVLLEISVPLATKRSVPGKVKCIFWLWVFAAIVLTSLYKDAFTTELIAPFKRSLTWRHVHELGDQGFKVFLPLKPNDAGLAESYSNGAQIKDLFAFDFSMDMQKITGGDLTDLPRLLGHRRFATAVLNTLIMGRKKRIGEKLTSAYFHYKWPAHVYPNLSRQEIRIEPTPRQNYVLKRVKSLIVSGIFGWWQDWFSRTRPKKLFPYYANWTKPKVERLDKLDFGARFVTIFRIWAICCTLCGAVGFVELSSSAVMDNFKKIMAGLLVQNHLILRNEPPVPLMRIPMVQRPLRPCLMPTPPRHLPDFRHPFFRSYHPAPGTYHRPASQNAARPQQQPKIPIDLDLMSKLVQKSRQYQSPQPNQLNRPWANPNYPEWQQ
ncbi:hypothetical protein Fcan01_24065 [Folsomia candida]|uniref:Uncharacterized protein n=1 Tax=Folsomia candida TaxID=158441 RepID=A0A226DAP1_FOLCA|nr:hypothetical protein Fcan01_24065 [Folsomia candida]